MSGGLQSETIVECAPSVVVGVGAMTTLTEHATAMDALLGSRELALASAIPHDRRRREWIGGRLLTKWLLRRHEEHSPGSTSGGAWPPALWSADAGALDALEAEWCRSIEI